MALGGNSGSSNTTLATIALEINAKLDCIFHMVTVWQAMTQQSIEALRAEFWKEREETAKRAAKKIHLSAEVTFKKRVNETIPLQ